MSDMQDYSGSRPDEAIKNPYDPSAALPANEEKIQGNTQLKDLDNSLDAQSYVLGEVPQPHLYDPQAFLPLNSDRLIGSTNMIEKIISEITPLIQDEVDQIQKLQKKISNWEDRLERNKAQVQKNEMQIKQNRVDINYDKKNRDYWWSRSEQVLLDYEHAQASNREVDWLWLAKKYGLKNSDGSQIDHKSRCVEEICQGAANNLAAEFKTAGNKYEQAKKDKETENTRMIHENGRLLTGNDQLQHFISSAYSNEIEPLQDGVLLFKELNVKLKSLSQNDQATYGDLRSWAEDFLDEFLKTNPRVSQALVTEFRRLTSIPLPAKNS